MHLNRCPARPSLEQLKNQAKDLLKAYRAREHSAIARFRESMPRLFGTVNDQPDPPSVSLRDAQHVVAAEYGFPSWSHMTIHIQERRDIFMFEMTVDGVRVSHKNQQRVVVLKAKEVNKYLPMWIGPAEGDSIAMKLPRQGDGASVDSRPDGFDDRRFRRNGKARHRERTEVGNVLRQDRASEERNDHRARLEAERRHSAGRPNGSAHLCRGRRPRPRREWSSIRKRAKPLLQTLNGNCAR